MYRYSSLLWPVLSLLPLSGFDADNSHELGCFLQRFQLKKYWKTCRYKSPMPKVDLISIYRYSFILECDLIFLNWNMNINVKRNVYYKIQRFYIFITFQSYFLFFLFYICWYSLIFAVFSSIYEVPPHNYHLASHLMSPWIDAWKRYGAGRMGMGDVL